MSTMTLAEAETHLSEALAALSRARNAISYGIGDRTLRRETLDNLQKDVARYQRIVNELTAAAAGVSNPSIITPKWT